MRRRRSRGSWVKHLRCSRNVCSASNSGSIAPWRRMSKEAKTILGPLPAHRPFEHMLLLRADVEYEASLRCVGINGERAPAHVISAGTRGPDPNAHRVSANLWFALIHPSAVRSCHLNSAESAFQILRKRERYLVRCCADCRAHCGTRMVEKGVSARNRRTE